jgi:hypothetical protein
MGILNLFMPRKDMASAQGSSKSAVADVRLPAIQAMDTESYLASDEKEWLRYLSQALRTYRKPGVSLKDEHKMWLAARAQSRKLMAAAAARAIKSN